MSRRLTLVVRPPGGPEHTITFDAPRVSVGRSPAADVRLPFEVVSAHHLTFSQTRGPTASYTVRDEGSTNGTAVDGALLDADTAVPVRDGMQLRIVDLQLEVHLHEASAAEDAVEFTLAQTEAFTRRLEDALRPFASPENDEKPDAFTSETDAQAAGLDASTTDAVDETPLQKSALWGLLAAIGLTTLAAVAVLFVFGFG